MIVSFYSYKGGVGRTQLCANVAAYLYHRKGKRVLLWDWDFEAPGLHYFFGKTNKDISSGGTLELLEEYMKSMRINPAADREKLPYFTAKNIIGLSSEPGKPGCVDLLPAGNYDDEFSFRSSNFDWFEFYSMNDGARYFELVKDNMKLLGYDYIFIDSRTGISDYSGICNVQLPEINVMVIAATMQNFEGCSSIISKIQESEYRKINEIKERILPILSRIDKSGPEYGIWVARFEKYFAQLIGTLDPGLDAMFVEDIFSDVYFAETCLHYTSAISAGENVFASDEKLSKTDFGRPFLQIAEHIESIAKGGKIDFYKKIDEATWEEYGDFAKNEENYLKAAYAYNQAGLLQSEPAKKSRYFQRALALVPGFSPATENLSKLGLNKLVLPPSAQGLPMAKDLKQKSRYYIYLIVGSVLIAGLISSAMLFNNRDKKTLEGGEPSTVITPAVTQEEPLRASAYFESIRESGKPIGVDISSKDQILDQSKLVRYGISFALIKATEGGSFADSGFAVNWAVSKNAKFKTGAYHYFSPKKTGDEQSFNYIKNVKLSAGDLPPILNLYGLDGAGVADEKVLANINTFLDMISVNYGSKPIVFASKSTVEKYFKGDFSRYSLWISDANQEKDQPTLPSPWKDWRLWQFSTRERFDGLNSSADKANGGLVDANVFNGTAQELEAFCISQSRGRSAVINAAALLMQREQLYKLTGDNRVIINGDTLGMKVFKKYSFNWSVELINHCFSTLNKKTLYGRNSSKLYRLLNYNGLLIDRSKNPEIGDIAFFDFQESKGIQTCGIIYNSDQDYIYLIEGSNPNGALNVRLTKRLKPDVYSYARLK